MSNQIQDELEVIPLVGEVGTKYEYDIFFALNSDGRFIEVSEAYCLLMGYSKAEFFEMNIDDVQIAGAQERINNSLQGVVDKGFAKIWIEQRTKDQRTCSFEISAFFSSYEEKIYCFANNRLAMPSASDSLALSLDLANRVIKNSSDLILITEAEPYHWPGPRIVFANDALLKTTGYSLEEVIGKTPRIFHGPNTDRDTTRRIHLALAKWQPIREEVLNYTKDGKEFWQELNIFPVANEDGLFTHWVSIQRNITERKIFERIITNAQDAIQESQQRLRLATHAGGVGIWDWDVVNDLLIWDDQMYALYGVQEDQFVGAYEAWQNGLHPDDREMGEQAIKDAIENGEFKLEFRIIRPDSSIRHIRGHARTIKNETGAVVRMIGTNWDITEQKMAENKAEELAFFDPLTTLPNRRLFADRLQRAFKLSARNKRWCALLSLDLDNFKMINDLHGHSGGDLILQATAQCLLDSVRAGDTVARMGGDEFIVLLEDLGSTAAEASAAARIVAEKILSSFNASPKAKSSIKMGSLSIGVAAFMSQKNLEIEEVIKQSDLALYQAKEAGRNCIKFYDEDMQATLTARASLLTALHQAIKHDWFVLHYQPQLNGDRQIDSAEVLLRLNHPEFGMMAPAEFIHLAESADLIVPIGWWVMNTACKQLSAWSSLKKMAHLSLSVNISVKQFQQENFVSELIEIATKTGANPNLLTLELTESLFLGDRAGAIKKMQALKDYGFNFALDDFGTGYSSLSYLKSLPFNEIKIDQSFVADIPGNQTSCDIIRIIILMGQTLEMKVVAEGVETKEQYQYLQAMGCHHYQGHLFSESLPLEQFVASIN